MSAPHPSQVLREQYLAPRGMTQADLGRALHVSRQMGHRIATGRTGITAEVALRLGRAFGTLAELWTGLQNEYNVSIAEPRIRAQLDRIVPAVPQE